MFAETEALAADLGAAPVRVMTGIVPVGSKGALNIKNNRRGNASGNPHARTYRTAITYDVEVHPHAVEAEIAPDKDLPQGPLGNNLEFATSNTPPHLDGQRALAAEEPRFM